MATVRQTKNSSKNQHRESLGTPNSNYSNRPPATVAQQYSELDVKISKLIESNSNLERQLSVLLEKVTALDVQNQALTAENIILRSKLASTEAKLSSIECDIESTKQKSLQNTVEILEVPADSTADPLKLVVGYSREVGSVVEKSDINNIYTKSTKTRNNTTKTKIIVEFTTLKKRKEFYFAAREHRFNKIKQGRQQSGGGNRPLKVVDALTHYKKNIFFSIADNRKIHPEVIRNVWITDGEIFIRRFGNNAAEPVKDIEFANLLFPAERVRGQEDVN
jgi:regulator of replication initiation timing